VTASERVWIFERTQWRDDAVTAADVFAFHVFRDLFAREALRPRTQMALRAATILFTDLCGSTRMYRDAGDAVAFGTVLDHFDVLREEVARAGGAVVKNMGDAIMAVFPRPAGAVEAAIAAMRRLAAAGLVLKAGAHHGPCIAVTWDDRLDYFGTTVNLAARAQQLSRGGDIVVAAPTHADPELRRWLEQNAPVVRCEGFSAQVRGFEPERLEFHRITPVVRTRSGPDLEKAFRCDLRLRARERHAGIGRGHRTCAALRAGDYGADGNNRA
jgi:class 3 adenylate cyclase